MYNHESTPPHKSDPLDREVLIDPNERPSPYLDDNLINALAAAAASHCGAAPTRELINLLAQAGAGIYQRSRRRSDGMPATLKDADGDVAKCFSWVARRRDARTEPNEPKWFEVRSHMSIDLGSGGQAGGDIGRLAHDFRTAFYESVEFAIYWTTRQRVAGEINARGVLMPYHSVMSQLMSGLSWPPAPSPRSAARPQPVARKKKPEEQEGQKGKPRKKQASIVVDPAWLMSELQAINTKRKTDGKVELKLSPTSLAGKSPPGGPHPATWRKLFNGESVRRDGLDHLILFLKQYGCHLEERDIPLK
jgi:hypothetical protein